MDLQNKTMYLHTKLNIYKLQDTRSYISMLTFTSKLA